MLHLVFGVPSLHHQHKHINSIVPEATIVMHRIRNKYSYRYCKKVLRKHVLLGTRSIVLMFPDMGLHDFDQLLLGDALIRYRHDFDNIVVVSHSEHIMLRVLRRIRETTDNEVEHTVAIQYDEVKVYYISNEYFARIGCKPNGTFDRRWPDGFFALRTQEL